MSRWYDGVLAELRKQRELIDQAIAAIEALEAVRSPSPIAAAALMPVPSAPVAVRPVPPRRTKERVVAPKGPDAQTTAILNALRTKARPLSVSELMSETKLSWYVVNNRLTQLGTKRQVVITGEPNQKRVALAGTPAKEEP